MCDAFLVLAQAPGGLSCFLLPRFTPDGARNRFHIQRLKDKLGNRSNASSEVEFRGAWARLVGEEGRGVQTILEMVNHTRLDCVIGSAAGMRCGDARRRSTTPRHRRAFGKLLIDQPLMRNVLADLALESEAATTAMMRLARAYDAGRSAPFRRLATAVAQVLDLQARAGPRRRGAGVPGRQRLRRGVGDAAALPRGAAQLDLGGLGQRAVPGRAAGDPEDPRVARRPCFAEIWRGRGATPGWTSTSTSSRTQLARPEELEVRARRLVERLALALQASLLVRHAPPEVADAFCASRLAGDGGRAFGTLPPGTDFGAILERRCR